MEHHISISKVEEYHQLIKEHHFILLYFSSKSCAVCNSLRPKVEELAKAEFPSLLFAHVESEKCPELTALHSVFSAPVISLIIEGKELLRFSKNLSINELDKSIRRYYDLYFG